MLKNSTKLSDELMIIVIYLKSYQDIPHQSQFHLLKRA